MFCNNCGSKLEANPSFCYFCGKNTASPTKDGLDQETSKITSQEKRPSPSLKIIAGKIYSRAEKIFKNRRLALSAAIVIGIIALFAIYNETQNTLRITAEELKQTQSQLTLLKEQQEQTIKDQQELISQKNQEIQKVRADQETTNKALVELKNSFASSSNVSKSSGIVKSFAKSVVRLFCKADRYSDDIQMGTGILYRTNRTDWEYKPYYVQTNLHVVAPSDGSQAECAIAIIPDYTDTSKYLLFESESYRFYKDYIDLAMIQPKVIADSSVKNRGTYEDLYKYASLDTDLPYCSETPEIGAHISVLGYPSIGGASLTVTDGIISGLETDQYGIRFAKISAKIDHGNSGGIAITDSGCSAGIPTFGEKGSFESIGRILDLPYLFNVVLK